MPDSHYIRDIAYTAGFYPEMGLARLAFAALAGGHAPGPAMRPERIFELGFGQGFGLALLAAANPGVSFEGCDFNPAHVAQAQRFIDEAALDNVVVRESSFAAAASIAAGRDCDLVLAHGVLSWVSGDVQQDIAAFLTRRLRPGGLFYVSYNALPGWAPLAPIRDLAREVKRRAGGGSRGQLATVLDWLGRLRRANAPLFAANPAAAAHLDAMLAMDPDYLAHEYLVEDARPLGFAEVAEWLNPAGLSHVARATSIENFDSHAVPAATLPLLAEIDDPILRETLRDFAVNRIFRRDVFASEATPSIAGRRPEALAEARFVLGVPPAALRLDFHGPAGPLTGKAAIYGPLADRLAGASLGLDELLLATPFGAKGLDQLLPCLALLIDSEQLYPVFAGPAADGAPARRFNAMVVDEARQGRFHGYLASPVAGTGIPVSDFDLLALAALADGAEPESTKLAHRALALLAALGRRPLRDGVPQEDDAEAAAVLDKPMQRALGDLSLWRRLGVV